MWGMDQKRIRPRMRTYSKVVTLLYARDVGGQKEDTGSKDTAKWIDLRYNHIKDVWLIGLDN